ncbi:MAG: glycosyltransferase [Bacteroidia bacterium]|nr:glycosyltransferase [Bacteroidia bacterium]
MEMIFFIFVFFYVMYWLILSWYFYYTPQKNISSLDSKTLELKKESLLFSIVICARNEEEKIERCLQSILTQKDIEKYAEIIFINDASEDNTLRIAENILSKSKVPYKIHSNFIQLGKKRSIEKAIEMSHSDATYIIFRDADTYTESDEWFVSFISHLNKNTDLIIAPVIYSLPHKNELRKNIMTSKTLNYLQYYEGLALMHLTLSSLHASHPILCNGANLLVKKSTFKDLNPYADNYHIRSGDDIFLLNKIRDTKGGISDAFCSSCIVYTNAPNSIAQLFQQKLRWLSKTTHNTSCFNLFSAIVIGLTNVSLFLSLLLSLKLFCFLAGIKTLTDWWTIFSVEKKLKIRHTSYAYFFIAELLYIPYVCALIFNFFIQLQKNDRGTRI